MTSSFVLKKLDEDQKNGNYRWSNRSQDFNEHDSPLGGLEHTYVKINGDCHPDFYATPIGNPHGAKLCRRKLESTLFNGMKPNEYIKSQMPQTGYYRASLNLYNVNDEVPTQITNPQAFPDRRIPWEADLIRDDYLRLPIKYNADGIRTVRTPHELKDKNRPYFEYGFSFLPKENPSDGRRVATSLNQSVPPPKYDITQGHQHMPVYLKEQEYVKNPLNFNPQNLTKRIV